MEAKQPTTISFFLSSPLLSSAASSCAVMQGANYLYIRIDGGPASSTGKVYGPYSVSTGSTFSTTAIPAGTYSSMGIILSSQLLEGRSVIDDNDNPISFENLLALSTAEFLAFVSNDYYFGDMLQGDASAAMLQNVTVTEGKVNSFPVVLRPVTNIILINGSIRVSEESEGLNRKYIKLDFSNYSTLETYKSLGFSFPQNNVPDSMMLFDSNGTFIYGGTPKPTANSATFISPYAMQQSLFLYVEFNGAALNGSYSLSPDSFHPVAEQTGFPKGNLTVSYAGGTATQIGKKLFVYVSHTGETIGNPLVGFGFAEITQLGSATVEMYNITENSVMLEAANGYNVFAFIDATGVHDSLDISTLSLTSISDISPQTGDYVLTTEITVTAATVNQILPENGFILYEEIAKNILLTINDIPTNYNGYEATVYIYKLTQEFNITSAPLLATGSSSNPVQNGSVIVIIGDIFPKIIGPAFPLFW